MLESTHRLNGVKKTENITWQEEGDLLVDLFRACARHEPQIKLAHAINLYGNHKKVASQSASSSDPLPTNESALGCEQTRVIQSMKEASASLEKTVGACVDFLGIVAPGDLHLVPDDFESIVHLERECMLGQSGSNLFPDAPQLPRLFDLLEAIKKSSTTATHVAFTNSDIHLQPWFYEVCLSFLQSGYDSLIVNRRTIEQYPTELPPGIPSSLRQAEPGSTHPGLDCFLFPKVWLDRFLRTEAVIGRGAVMRSLLFNMVALAENMLVLSHAQMTYHFGDDRPWMKLEAQAARNFNKDQAAELWLRLAKNETYRARLLAIGKLFTKYLPELSAETLSSYLKDS